MRRENLYRINKLICNMREGFKRFMVGRYGLDELGQALKWLVLLLIVVNILLLRGRRASQICNLLELAGLLLLYLRVFSRNTGRRFRENQAYLRLRFQMSERWKRLRRRAGEVRDYRIFRCPGCGQRVRVPRGHGRVSVRCPKCGREFLKRT